MTTQEQLDKIHGQHTRGVITRDERDNKIVETYAANGRTPTGYELEHGHADTGQYRSACAACDDAYERNVSS